MLNFIRDHAHGWLAWLIVGLISVPFALWGVNSYLQGNADVVVAKVNGTEVNQTQLQASVQQYRNQMRNILGDRFDPSQFEGVEVKRQVLNGLIERQVVLQAVHDKNMAIPDAELSARIRGMQAFQKDGKFNQATYESRLGMAGTSSVMYEAQMRNDLLSQQLVNSVQSTVLVTPKEVNDALALDGQLRKFGYGVIPVKSYLNKAKVSDEQIKQYYELNQARYKAPEFISVNYIVLSLSDLEKQVKVTDAELKTFYESNIQQFVEPTQRRASHILVTGKNAKQQIEKINQSLSKGKSFSALAKQFSKDIGSSKQGGDLGYMQKGLMAPEFDSALFSLKAVGDVSQPVKMKDGYHLIKLTGIKASKTETFTEAKAEVEKSYRQQQAQKNFDKLSVKLGDITYQNSDSLDTASNQLGLKIQTTKKFGRQGEKEGLASNKQFIKAAFSDDVIKSNLNSEVISLSDTEQVVLHKNTYIPAQELPLKVVSPQIKQQLAYEQATDKAREQGVAIIAKMKAGGDIAKLVSKWTKPEEHSRQASSKVSSQLIQHAFAMPKPDGKTQYSGFSATNGNYVIIGLESVKAGELTGDKKKQQAVKQALMRNYASSETQAFISALKAKADISIKESALK